MSMCEGNIYCEIYRNKKYCHRTEAASEYRECIGCRHAKRRCEVGLATMPAADVAPVVHGLWEEEPSSFWRWTPSGAVVVARTTYRCGLCGRGTAVKSNYCPNCGAKMDGGNENV